MRCSTRGFVRRKALAMALERRFPERFIPRYSMVMFHPEIPYAEALRRGAVQAQLLEELDPGPGSEPDPAARRGWSGSGCRRWPRRGDAHAAIMFPRPAGAYAELVAAPSRQLARKPREIDHVHAAALPLVGLTAWQCLVDVGAVRPGMRVLVHGAGGGVGHIAVQIAKARGAFVLATASAEKRDFVKWLGADQVIDYRRGDFSTSVRDVDVVLETIGADNAERSLQVLKPGGHLITIVDRANEALAGRTRAAGFKFSGVTVEPDHQGLEELARLVDGGKLRIHVERTFPLEQARAAHELLASHLKGKIVLTM